MAPVIKGQQLLNILDDMQQPAQLKKVVEQIALNVDQPLNVAFMNKAKSALEAGVRYGYIGKRNDRYFVPEEASDMVAENVEDVVPKTKSVDKITTDADDPPARRGRRRRRASSSRSRSRSRSQPVRRSSRRRRRR
uniref:DUF4777 domain-containing protein n=1 Tax=Musca domestica TaxID=7370 RepID=A0A1I8NJL0_MUSDO